MSAEPVVTAVEEKPAEGNGTAMPEGSEDEDLKLQNARKQSASLCICKRMNDRLQLIPQSSSILQTRTYHSISEHDPPFCTRFWLIWFRFMWTMHTANAEHWVPIKTVSSFKRMREYAAMGHDWIVKALRTSEELEVDEAGENARRRTEVQPPKGQFERSIYAVSRIIELSANILMRCIAERVWRGDT